MQRYPMTPQGHAALEAELKQLKSVDRPRITASIAEAREHGDLKENAEYHAAREQQGFCEARIRDIEAKLGGAQVIDPSTLPKEGRIVFGVSVVIENMDTEEEKQYKTSLTKQNMSYYINHYHSDNYHHYHYHRIMLVLRNVIIVLNKFYFDVYMIVLI